MPTNYAKGFHFSTFCWHLLFFESFKTVAILMCIKYYLTHKGRFLILLSARERGKLCDENTQLGGFHLVKATRKSTWRKKWLIGGLNTRRALALYKVETKAFRKWGQEQLHCGSLNRAHPGVKEGQCGWGGSGRWNNRPGKWPIVLPWAHWEARGTTPSVFCFESHFGCKGLPWRLRW